MSFAALQAATGGFWPYLVVIFIGFVPTEFWRVMAIFLAKNLEEDSELLHWVRLVASALLVAVVAKLVLSPTGMLARIPTWGRLGAVAAGLLAMGVTKRSILAAVFAGELVLISAGIWG